MAFKRLLKISLLTWCLAAPSVVIAGEKVVVIFGEVLAPWVIPKNNEGIIVDLFITAMNPLGYEVIPVYMPYSRRAKAYKTDDVDVVSDMNPNTIEDFKLPGYFSDIAYSYENFAISLAKHNFQFTHVSQLQNHSVLSWQDAIIHLGGEYAAMAKRNPRYAETFDQSAQVRMLFLERYEVVQMDKQIFNYYRGRLAESQNVKVSQKVDRFALFGASPNGFLFKSKSMRDQFNEQLRSLKLSGQYQDIFMRYEKGLPKD